MGPTMGHSSSGGAASSVGPGGSEASGMTERRTIVFFPEGAFGPTNNCVGIGSILQRRGHRVVFVVEESFAGRSTHAASRRHWCA